MPHCFCPECCSSVLIDFTKSYEDAKRPQLALNAGLFKDIDLANADFTTFDRMNQLDPKYKV